MKKILVAIGYGKFSPQYYGYAQQLAHYFDASIMLVHVYDIATPITENEYVDMDDVASSREFEVQALESERLTSFSEEFGLLEFDHIKVESMAVEGDISTAFTKIINEGSYNLLLMGMRKHRLKDRLLGNVVQRVIDNINIPILLVASLANIRLVKDIVYATAFDVGTIDTVEYILDWCLAFNARVTLVHVAAQQNKQMTTEKFKYLREHYYKENKADILSTKLLYGNVQQELNEYVERTEADILVVHNRKKGFWHTIMSDNLSIEMTESLNIPLLVLPNTSTKISFPLS